MSDSAADLSRMFGPFPEDLPRSFKMARRYALGATLEEIGAEFGMGGAQVREVIDHETPWSTEELDRLNRREPVPGFLAEDPQARGLIPSSIPTASDESDSLGHDAEHVREVIDFDTSWPMEERNRPDLGEPAMRLLAEEPVMHGPTRDDIPRPFEMARRYGLGETLDEIGKSYGLSRERIRQIINNETPWTTTVIGKERRERQARNEARDRELVHGWSKSNAGVSIESGAKELGLDEEELRRHLGRRRGRHEIVDRKVGLQNRGRSLEDLISDLQRFHAETGATTAAAYSQWAKRQGVPGHQTVSIRFGSWNAAAAQAGIKNEAPIERDRRHSDEDLWAAVIEATRSGIVTFKDFEDWLVNTPGAPSGALVRNRLELGWNDIREEALQVLNGSSERGQAWVAAVLEPRDWAIFLEAGDPMEDMRAARLALGKNITMERYREWAHATKRPGPMTVMIRSGMRWGKLVEAVGGTPVRKQVRISDEELLAWLRAFLESVPEGSWSSYESWRDGVGAPTATTIASRLGGWEAAREKALAGPGGFA